MFQFLLFPLFRLFLILSPDILLIAAWQGEVGEVYCYSRFNEPVGALEALNRNHPS